MSNRNPTKPAVTAAAADQEPARGPPKPGETWRHFKGGVYRIAGTVTATSKPADGAIVVGIATHTETRETVLIYGPPKVAVRLRLVKSLMEGAQCSYLVRREDEAEAPALVLYSRKDRTSSDLWARPLANFMSGTGKGDKPEAPRFELAESEPGPGPEPGPSN